MQNFKPKEVKLGVGANICGPNTRLRKASNFKFEASLDHTVSSRTTKALHGDPVSKKETSRNLSSHNRMSPPGLSQGFSKRKTNERYF